MESECAGLGPWRTTSIKFFMQGSASCTSSSQRGEGHNESLASWNTEVGEMVTDMSLNTYKQNLICD